MGPCTASSCCCQARNLPWAPVTNSSCCCQARKSCHGPLYRPLMLLPGPESVHGSLYSLHCCCLHRHTLPCATFRSLLTLLVGSIFVIGCFMASHCCCLHRPHCGSPHSGFGPVTAQMSEVCGDSKIDGNSSACHTD
ncbi:unnamed protein product [Staurois parvus]|uniref:Uncharacterized protein n=1 Tax=Staurois parvus TaxID=386267 RepID=A0ABN9H7G1_9NEOB|nr:unnamed protein product [Staurois parvus]